MARLARLNISLHDVLEAPVSAIKQEGVRPLDSQLACSAYSADAKTGSECSSASSVSLLDCLHVHF